MMVSDPSFEAASTKDGEVEKFRFTGEGVTLVAFFPGAFTPTCTQEMCEIRNMFEEMKDTDIDVIGVSVDTPFSLKRFSEENDLTYRLVSDTAGEIAEKYGVLTKMPGLGYQVAARSLFVVDDGEVVHSQQEEDLGSIPDLELALDEAENCLSN